MEHQKQDKIIEEILLYLQEKNYRTSPYKIVKNKSALIFNTTINKDVRYTITVYENKNIQVQPYDALYSQKIKEELKKSNLMKDEILGHKLKKLFNDKKIT